ncbi:MAG: lipoprotein insertase outer membrane protein LolB [Gammaproteobacteria bacterium]
MPAIRTLTALLCCLALVACAPPPVERSDAEIAALWQQQKERNEAIETWRLNGRIRMQSDAENWYASLIWRQKPVDYDIRLVGPLGSGTVLIKGGSGGVVLRTDKGETIRSSNPDNLFHRAMGWNLPVSSLNFWVRGLPQPGPAILDWDNQGRLSGLHQHGWDVEFTEYFDDAAHLPETIQLTRGEWHIRLDISRWKI